MEAIILQSYLSICRDFLLLSRKSRASCNEGVQFWARQGEQTNTVCFILESNTKTIFGILRPCLNSCGKTAVCLCICIFHLAIHSLRHAATYYIIELKNGKSNDRNSYFQVFNQREDQSTKLKTGPAHNSGWTVTLQRVSNICITLTEIPWIIYNRIKNLRKIDLKKKLIPHSNHLASCLLVRCSGVENIVWFYEPLGRFLFKN